jgi:putative FmdB family regulatory protein
MPLYSFVCDNRECAKKDKIMEFLIKLASFDKEVTCPGCGRILRRLLSAPLFTINV